MASFFADCGSAFSSFLSNGCKSEKLGFHFPLATSPPCILPSIFAAAFAEDKHPTTTKTRKLTRFCLILAVSVTAGPRQVPVRRVATPKCFSLLAVRCIPLPQGGRATGPSPGAGYRAGARGIPQYPEVGRLAVWVRLQRSAARSASQSTQAVGSSRSIQQ